MRREGCVLTDPRGGSLLYGEVLKGPPPPQTQKTAKYIGRGLGAFREIVKYITKIVDMRKTAVFRFFTHLQKSSDGAISIAAFFGGVSCQHQKSTKVSCQEERDGRSGYKQFSGRLCEAVLPMVWNASGQKYKRQAEEVLLGQMPV